MSSIDSNKTKDSAFVERDYQGRDGARWQFDWLCEKWSQEAVDFCIRKLEREGVEEVQDGNIMLPSGLVVPNMIPVRQGIPNDLLRKIVGEPEEAEEIHGNLLLNAGIQRMIDNLKGVPAATAVYDNTHARIGIGDSATAEAATQTDLIAGTNRQYKLQNATYPLRPGSNGAQSVDWRSDFLTGEANYVWNEWVVDNGTANGTAAGAGPPVLNRKVQSLGTKATGTWTMTGTLTIS